VVEKDAIEFFGYGFLLVFDSNCRPTTRRSATIHERDQATNDVTSRHMISGNMRHSLWWVRQIKSWAWRRWASV